MRKRKYIILLLFILLAIATVCFFLKCNGNEEKTGTSQQDEAAIDTIPMMVTRIQQCSRLNTAEVKVHKIITHDDAKQVNGKLLGKDVSFTLPVGKRKIAIPLYATIKASIDLQQISDDDIIRTGDHIEVFLPHPVIAITETHVDHDGVRQYVALTRSNFTDEEMLTYERQGRDAIEKDIPKMGIEEMARESAARQLVPIIRMMGFKEENITISFRNQSTIVRSKE